METDLIARQANKLIESVYRMEVEEQKLILLATKKVNDLELLGLPFTSETEVVITADEFAKAYGINKQRAFEALVDAKNTIYDRSFEMNYVDAQGVSKPISSRWIHAKGEMKAKSEVSMFFTPAVIPFIYLVVKEEFTMLDLKEVGRLKSKYAVRLYQLLMKWRNADRQPFFTIENLRDKLGLSETEYLQVGDFNKRVIQVAVTQINKGTGFVGLEAKPKKSGRTIIGFSFPYEKYLNDTITVVQSEEKKPKQSKKSPNSGTQGGEYVIYQMTDKQISMVVSKIVASATKGLDGFAGLDQLVDAGKGWDSLAEKLTNEFVDGNFAPYYEYLRLVEFIPTAINKTPPADKQDANNGTLKPDPALPPVKPKQKPAPVPVENEQLDLLGRSFRGIKARTIAENMLKQAFYEDNSIFSDIKERMEFGNHTQVKNEIIADLESGNLEKYEAELKYFESRRML